jgi:hypothetical protein
MLTTIFAVAVLALCGLVLFALLVGVPDNLNNAHVGGVYSFRYLQPMMGEYDRHVVKVVKVRRLNPSDIVRLNYGSKYREYDGNFNRSETLVTCIMPNGEYRNFYAERSDWCYRKIGGRLLYTTGIVYLM